MARFKRYDYTQDRLLPIRFGRQILPGTFEFALSHIIDTDLDLSEFEQMYSNDQTGAPAYDPAILLKIILYAYSKGIFASRKIAQCCDQNIIFMALSADTQPHYTTISNFISTKHEQIVDLFVQVLMICDEMKLIGREMFAIDGCKLPSNASKQWSGTRNDFERKMTRMKKQVAHIVKKHRQCDKNDSDELTQAREEQYKHTLEKKISKFSRWLKEHNDKIGKSGKAIQSNITDNDSAKMRTSKGVIQGYNGVAVADGKHQVIVAAQAYGSGAEQDVLKPMIDQVRQNFEFMGDKKDVFSDRKSKAKLTADAGYHSNENLKMLAQEKIDAYVADPQRRKRDERFADVDKYKQRHRKERRKLNNTTMTFGVKDFKFDGKLRYCICPAGKRLYRNGGHKNLNGYRTAKFNGRLSDCRVCHLRAKCLRYPGRSEYRQVHYFIGKNSDSNEPAYIDLMKAKIDSDQGRAIYGKRIGTIEPVFAHIRTTLRLDRFTLRGQKKVNVQWLLYSIIHNLKKAYRYGPLYNTS